MLGENIYNLRKEKKLSQEQLAEEIGVSRQTISNWELGETSPNPKQLKLLSKTLNTSIDELLNNEVNTMLVEKVSNTEKLAGLILKVLKWLGIIFIIMLVIDFVSLIIFTVVKKEATTKIVDEITMSCQIDENDYLITVGSDGYFNCSNCDKTIQKDLKELVDYNNISANEEIITEYFEDNNGLCE